ncbi:MAG: hypothetical protein ACKOXM_03190 [Agromyces sp.]
MSTIQLRRYQLGEGTLDTFMDWWVNRVVPIRLSFGYQVEFVYFHEETSEIVWAARVEGDRAHFDAVEAAYDASEDRIEAFTHLPAGVVLGKDIRIVEELDLAAWRK